MFSGGRAWTRCAVFGFVHLEVAGDCGGHENSETLLTSCKESCEFSKSYLDRIGCQHAEETITTARSSSCSQARPHPPHQVHGIGDSQARPMFPHREGLRVTPGLGPPRGSEQAGQKVVLIRHKLLERQTYAQGLCALGRRLMSRPRLTFKSYHLGRKLTGCGAVWPASGCL